MNPMVCELCGSNDIVKQDGFFVCQHCGTKYSLEEARRLLGTVKVDKSDETEKLLVLARRARKENNSENAGKYYGMILVNDPGNWEANFFNTYYQAFQCKIAGIDSAAIAVKNSIDSTLKIIKETVDEKEQSTACAEIALYAVAIEKMLYEGAKSHYKGIDSSIRDKYKREWESRATNAIRGMKEVGDKIDEYFGDNVAAQKLAVTAWKQTIETNIDFVGLRQNLEQYSPIINSCTTSIKKYEPDYMPQFRSASSGCYVATAVYGSYDCPEVWTLRRYRDYTLAETWYGRAFIRTYYAISPTLVRWFGKTQWFRNLWKPKLDTWVAQLNREGVANTPYNDINW